MNLDRKIAIVVPAYKVERYIRECLVSILEQSFINWVCYIVNDGTPDKSVEIAESFSELDRRFIVLHKTNGGLSSARNTALNIIFKQDFHYLYFLDSDDLIPPNFLDKMLASLEHDHADFSICATRFFDTSGILELDENHPKEIQTFNKDQIADMYFLSGKGNVRFDCKRFLGNKVFRLTSIKGKLFREEMKSAEDQDWMVDNLLKLKKATFTPHTHFLYRLRSSSISHSSDILQDYNTFYRVLNTTFDKYSPFAQHCIQNRFIETLYNQITLDILQNEDVAIIQKRIVDGKAIISKKVIHNSFTSKSQKYLKRFSWPLFVLQFYVRWRTLTKPSYKKADNNFFE